VTCANRDYLCERYYARNNGYAQNLEALAAGNPVIGAPHVADASMLLRRLKIYKSKHKVNKPSGKLRFCRFCSAELALAWAGVDK